MSRQKVAPEPVQVAAMSVGADACDRHPPARAVTKRRRRQWRTCRPRSAGTRTGQSARRGPWAGLRACQAVREPAGWARSL